MNSTEQFEAAQGTTGGQSNNPDRPSVTEQSASPTEAHFVKSYDWARTRLRGHGTALEAYEFLSSKVWTDNGFNVGQDAIAEAIGRSRRTVIRVIDLLEATHYSHGQDEPCPGDGTCVQLVVRRRENYLHGNGWARYWVNTSEDAVDAALGVVRLPMEEADEDAVDVTPAVVDVTQMSPPEVTPVSHRDVTPMSPRKKTETSTRRNDLKSFA